MDFCENKDLGYGLIVIFNFFVVVQNSWLILVGST